MVQIEAESFIYSAVTPSSVCITDHAFRIMCLNEVVEQFAGGPVQDRVFFRTEAEKLVLAFGITVQQNLIKFRFPIFFKTCTIRQQHVLHLVF